MRKIGLMLVACLVVALAGCGAKKPKDMIVGKWESTDPKIKGTQEYKPDGTLIFAIEDIEMKGKYKFVEDELMEVELEPPLPGAPKMKQKVKVKVTDDELSATDEKGETSKLKKKK